jgi:PD-(D/E)XK endonuclease
VFVLPSRFPTDHPVDVGLRSEVALTNRFVQLGHAVFLPVGHNHRYDLLVEGEAGRFLRVQCKTGRLTKGVIRFNTVSVRSNRRDVHRRGYAGEVDAFAVWCPQNQQAYLVPVEDLATGIGTLRVEATGNHQRRGIRWATDYMLQDPAAEPRTGFEPATPALQERCSTN